MKNLHDFSIFLLILFFPLIAFAQIPGMVNYSEEDGLNSSYTYALKQDDNGFIWIGTDNGLFRFDGNEFKQYNKQGLKNIDVLSCIPLSNGENFILPFLSDYAYLKNDKIINSDMNKELKKMKFSSNPAVFGYKDSIFAFSLYNPKDIYIYHNGKVNNIPLHYADKKSPDTNYNALAYDHSNKLLYLSDLKTKVEAYNIITKEKTTCNISLTKETLMYRKGDFYISKFNGEISIYHLENKFYFKKIQSFSFSDSIYQIIIDENYRVWLCMNNGGLLYFNDPLSSKKKIAPPIHLMGNYIIQDVLIDKDDNVWVSTRNDGIYFIPDRFFKSYIDLPIKNNSSYIKTITKYGTKIILGYNEAKSGIFSGNKVTDIVLEKNRKIENKAIITKGNTIIFGLSQYVTIYDAITKKKYKLKENSIKNVVPYTDTSVLICSGEGLAAYNFVSHVYSDILKGERFYTALLYDKDSLFVGNFKDLYKVNPKTKKKILFMEGLYINDLKKLKSNLYVAATNSNGILIFNNKKIIKNITQNEGLTAYQIKKIEIENDHVFWASTNSGLSRVEFANNRLKINNFTQTDGLPSNLVSGCIIKNDSLYVGTSKGLGIFSIHNLLSQQKFINKRVIINSVTIGDQEVFDLNKNIIGQTPNNTVTFNLSFPDYISQGKVKYQYKVGGLNDEWQISNSPKIIFNSLPPGKYIFKVFGLGYNGKKSYISTDLSFEIKPKFWQTWWFKLLVIILIGSLLFSLITLYFQRKRNKKLETLYYEKKIAELELQAIKAQINPHFIYNCLNSIQFLLYKKDYTETENYLDIFSQMIRKTLHYSEKTFMPIKEETEYLSLYLNMEKLRLKEQFDYKITISNRVQESWIIPSLLIQPFVENAIKHGISSLKDRKGYIHILFDYVDSLLCITIEDNGIGIGSKPNSTAKANSFGVKLSQKRIETFRQLFETNITLELNDLFEKEQKPGTQIKLYMTPYENESTSLHH